MTERETVLLQEFKAKLDKLINLHLRMKKEKQLFISPAFQQEANPYNKR